MDALRNGLFNELKDSLQHADMPDNIVDFVKMCSKRDSQIRATATEKMSGRWEGSYKKPDNMNNTTSAPEAFPVGTVVGYHGALTWTSQQSRAERSQQQKEIVKEKEFYAYTAGTQGILWQAVQGS
jgi:hypothetical protein